MNIPQITSIDIALKIYYKYPEIGNKEIKQLFNVKSSATISRLKKMVITQMLKEDVPTFSAHKVRTSIAYEVWGISVADLEYRMKKIQKLNL